jgi:NitT/TauT family transport system permease protein
MRNRLAQISSLAILLIFWALVAHIVGTDVLPTPRGVVPDFWDLIKTGEFVTPLGLTVLRTVVGFLTAVVVGCAVGIGMGRREAWRRGGSLILDIALFAPALVVIFLGIAMLGTGTTTIAVVVTICVAPTVVIYIRDAMRDIDRDMLAMADAFHVVGPQRVRDVYLPYLIPPFLGMTRVCFSMSWKIVILTEVFGYPSGVGFEIEVNYSVYNLPRLMAWLAVFVIALLVAEQILRATEHVVVRWKR